MPHLAEHIADFICVKNPNASLEQLRRSSVAEFEHLKKDPHPDPPLRALPEHSVLHGESATATHHSLGGVSVGGLDGSADQSSEPTSRKAEGDSSNTTSQTSQQIQSGQMTFTLPDFDKDNGADKMATKEDVLSPTQAHNPDDESKTQTLF
jgi:glycogenin glucosyltransferase